VELSHIIKPPMINPILLVRGIKRSWNKRKICHMTYFRLDIFLKDLVFSLPERYPADFTPERSLLNARQDQ
jgi:hypothetical protein